MKKQIFLLLTSLLCLNGCGESPRNSDTPFSNESNNPASESSSEASSSEKEATSESENSSESSEETTNSSAEEIPSDTSSESSESSITSEGTSSEDSGEPIEEKGLDRYKISYIPDDKETYYASKELSEATSLKLLEEDEIDTSKELIYLRLDSNLDHKYNIEYNDKSFIIKSDTAIGLIEGAKSLYQHYLNGDEDLESWYTTPLKSDYFLKDKISIMSYNVRTKNDGTLANGDSGNVANRGPRIVKAIKTWLPDTVGVQEAGDNWNALLRDGLFPQYGYIGQGRNNSCGGESSGIYYNRDKVTLLASETKWLSETPDVPGSHLDYYGGYNRIVTYGVFQRISDGFIYLHANTHLDLKQEPNAEDARIIDRLISPYKEYMPVFLTGDYNCTPASEGWAYDVLTNDLNYEDPRFEVSDFIDVNQQTFPQIGYSSTSTTGGSIIDFCLRGNAGLHYTKYRVDTEPYSGDDVEKPQLTSDHYPIYFEAIPYTPIKGIKPFINEHNDIEIDNSFAYHDKAFDLIKHQSQHDKVTTVLARNSFFNGSVVDNRQNYTEHYSVNISNEGGFLEYKFNNVSNSKADLNLVMASSLYQYGGMKNIEDYISLSINSNKVDLSNIDLRCSDVRQKYEWENLVLRNVDLLNGENIVRIETKNNVSPDQLLLEIFSDEVVSPIENDRPLDPRNLLEPGYTTLKIEAESGTILDQAGNVKTGIEEGKTREDTNNPSNDSYVYGTNYAANKSERLSMNYFVKANKAGKAVLSLALGLNKELLLSDVYSIYLNGEKVDYYNPVNAPSFTDKQYFDWTLLTCALLELNEGVNVISIRYLGNANALNFDYLELDSNLELSAVPTSRYLFDANTAKAYGGTWNEPSDTDPVKTNGFYSSTKNKTFTYEINAEEDCIAMFNLYAARNKAEKFDQLFASFTVNGSEGNVIKDGGAVAFNAWHTYYEVNFAILKLSKGVNTITFKINSGQTTNLAGISFISPCKISINKQ